MAECVSFGKWARMYTHLQWGRTPIAKQLDLPVDVLESWLDALYILRNTCAHHGRVWNRRFTKRPKRLNKEKAYFDDQTSFYCLASAMAIMARRIDPDRTFVRDMTTLLTRYPEMPKAWMGIPEGWLETDLWHSPAIEARVQPPSLASPAARHAQQP